MSTHRVKYLNLMSNYIISSNCFGLDRKIITMLSKLNHIIKEFLFMKDRLKLKLKIIKDNT